MAGLASMALGDAYVNIMGETAGLQRSLAQAHAMVLGFAVSAGGMLAKAAFMTPFVVGGVMVYSIKKFMEAEVVSNRLASAINLVGGNIDVLIPKYNKLADAVARKTKWDDEQVKSAMSMALGMGMSAEKMEEAIPAAIGLAARRGIDLSSAMMMITRAGMGNTMMLQRWFPELKKATTQQEKWNATIKIGKAGMGMAEDEVNTLSGAFGQMRKALGEVTENYGYNIEKALSLTEIVKYLTGWIWRWKEATDGINASNNKLTASIGLLQLLGSKVIVIWMTINALAKELGAAIYWVVETVGTSFHSLGVAIGTITNAIYTQFEEAFGWLGQYIKTAVTNIVTWWKETFSRLWDWLKSGWTGVKTKFEFPEWKGLFAGVEEGAQDRINNIITAWETAAETIASLPWMAPWRGKLLEDIEQIKEIRDLMAESIVAGPTRVAAAMRTGERVDTGGTAEKASASIISIADVWKKMQEDATKKRHDEKMAKISEDQLSTQRESRTILSTINRNIALGRPAYGFVE